MIDIIIAAAAGFLLGAFAGGLLTCIICALIVSKPIWRDKDNDND